MARTASSLALRNDPWKVGILVCSTRAARGQRDDASGQRARELVTRWWKADVAAYRIVPDDQRLIARTLRNWCEQGIDAIFTVGGSGFSPTDITPEATREVISREASGLAQLMRVAAAKKSPEAFLSRAIAGLRDRTLIVNLPGGEDRVSENLSALKTILPQALEALTGERPAKSFERRQSDTRLSRP